MGNHLGVDCSGSLLRVACVYLGEEEERVCVFPPTSLRRFLDHGPIWGRPGSFSFSHANHIGQSVCFVIDWSDLETAIDVSLSSLAQLSYIELTGSRSKELQSVLHSKSVLKSLPIHFHREISCIREAIDFLLYTTPLAFFTFSKTSSPLNSRTLPTEANYTVVPYQEDNLYPFLLVNVKGGVSFHLVTSPSESRRVGGSTIGGGTFVGLSRLLMPNLGCSLDAFLLAQEGDLSHTDMLVGDIYGGGYGDIGLKANVVASTFGKCQNSTNPELKKVYFPRRDYTEGKRRLEEVFLDPDDPGSKPPDQCSEADEHPTEADAAKSILTMTTYNIAQQAYLNSVLCGCKRIVLVGYYLEMPGYLAAIQHCIDFWSEKKVTTVFVRLATNLGALGAALRRRRRGSGAHLTDIVIEDKDPPPHRLYFKNSTTKSQDF